MLSALLLLAQTAEPVRIEAEWTGTQCAMRIEGTSATAAELDRAARIWARHGRPVRVHAAADTPYRCIGGTLFTLQVAGYGMYMAVASPPAFDGEFRPTIRFSVPAKGCTALVNDIPASEAELEALGADWRRYQPEVHFQPDPRSDYACVEKMLAILTRMHVERLGFIGNEQFDPEQR
jgi:hypothetical protein